MPTHANPSKPNSYEQPNLGERSRVMIDADGLASGGGPAFDLSLRQVRDIPPSACAFARLKMSEKPR